jgi:tetratricopeptide (TPR) repeat protein
MFVYTVYSALMKGGDGLGWFDLFNNMITAFTVSVAGLTLLKLADFKGKLFHRYDESLIGTAFAGLKRSSMLFEEGLELFHRNDFRRALEVFTDLGNGDMKLTAEETGVNEFYRGRCYQIMNAFPNAILCYEKAQENGFYIPELPIFIARCHVENGNAVRAREIYSGLMDGEYKYSNIICCEMGNMYLKLNDGASALEWFGRSIDNHENYAEALCGAALANVLLGIREKGEELYQQALIAGPEDPNGFRKQYKVFVELKGSESKEN